MTVALALSPDWEAFAAPIATVSTAIMVLTLRPGLLMYRLLTLKPVLSIGLMSYSLYLWHWSVIGISRWTIGINLWTAPLQLGIIIALSGATYLYVERPLRHLEWSPKRLITIGYGAIAIFVASSCILALQFPLRGKFYTGEPADLTQAGVASLVNDRWSNGRVIWPAQECVLVSNNDVSKTISWDRCTFGVRDPSKRKFLVIGNSFSAAEFEMYAVLAERNLGSVTATSSWGASPVPEIPNRGPWSKANDYYWSHVVPTLIENLRAGDVLIMINGIAGVAPQFQHAGSEKLLKQLEAGLSRIALKMRQNGISVIFETGHPFMQEAQCTPNMAKQQWFHFVEPTNCTYYTRTETLARRAPLDDVLSRIRKDHRNFYVLDLMPVLCATNVCKMFNDEGTFLYRDEWSHMSAEANLLARKPFLSVVNDINYDLEPDLIVGE